MLNPAYRIHTPRLVVRCWDPHDAPLLKEAIDSSLEHLRPWMPWAANEPEAVEEKVRRLRRWRGLFDTNEDFVYGIFNEEESAVLGGCGLHTRVADGALEIGYWIRASATNQGYATEMAAALTQVAFRVHDVRRVEIHCDPANGASAAVARKLGYSYDGTLRAHTLDSDGQPSDSMLWTMLSHEAESAPASAVAIQAFDVTGENL